MPPRMAAAASASRRMRTFVFRRRSYAARVGPRLRIRMRAGPAGLRSGLGAPLRCGSLCSPPLRSAPAPAPETTPRELLSILILLFLALLINYDYWKCLRDIGTEGERVCQNFSALTTTRESTPCSRCRHYSLLNVVKNLSKNVEDPVH
jgi:hypothetical protein